MPNKITIHFDNQAGFSEPALLVQQKNKKNKSIKSMDQDNFGFVFEVPLPRAKDWPIFFKFADATSETAEDDSLWRRIDPAHFERLTEVWCRGWNAFVYIKEPTAIESQTASEKVNETHFKHGIHISDTDGRYALGANPTQDGGVLFGLFHPHAAAVYVVGDFNDWQYPNNPEPQEEKFLKMKLYPAYFEDPNVWLLKVDNAHAGQNYKFFVQYQSLAGTHVLDNQLIVDPYARFLGEDNQRNNAQIIDSSPYVWKDQDFQAPPIEDLIIYELHVDAFTRDHEDIPADQRGKYTGLIQRIQSGYFNRLGVNCLYLMPIAETTTPQGDDVLGYDSSLFIAIERDFGTPDELRYLVDVAHQHGLAIIVDQVFNHSSNNWNPLWKFILDHPDETEDDAEGGLYFNGTTPWGNRLSTGRTETQNMLIDACKLMITEYHIDGFRFDGAHSNYTNHGFLNRLADEIQAYKPEVILVAENLPNETDLNREGFNGFSQWNDHFHDTMKAFLREAPFEGVDNNPENLGDVFYFSKGAFASHTNNVINYCKSHDEHSVATEVGFIPSLDTPQAKERKARLGLFATMVALGQPMIYMGQELGRQNSRNYLHFELPANLEHNNFYHWAAGLINLRRRYPALKLHGYNPMEDGQFHWLIGPWMDSEALGAGKRVIGWRSTPSENLFDHMVVLLNFENHPVDLEIPFGQTGTWVQLASIDYVNDISPDGDNSPQAHNALYVKDDSPTKFTLPDSSGFIYKWESN